MNQIKKIFLKNSENNFFIFRNEKPLTYKAVLTKALSYGEGLERKSGSLKNKIIFVKSNRSQKFFITIISLFLLECIVIPISSKITNKELLYLRKKYRPFIELNGEESFSETNFSKKNKQKKVSLKKSKIIFFTSGTTGQPKGITHNIHNLLQSAKSFSKLANYTKKDLVLHNWPHYYMAGIFNMFLCPFVSGGKIFFDEEIGINSYLNYWKDLKKNKISIAYLSPTMAHALISYSKYSKSKVKNIKTRIISTGSYLYNSTKNNFKKMFSKDLINCYGITEVGGSISLAKNKNKDPGSIGELSRGVNLKISKNNEILITSKYMFEGYLEDKAKKKKFNNSFFNSGDLGIKKNKDYILTGRSKEIIKKGGEAVSLLKIEDIALNCKIVKDVIAKGIPSEFWGEDIEIKVVFTNFKKDNIEIFKRYLVEKLSRLEFPHKIEIVKSIPKTSIGKNYRQTFIN